MERPISSGWRRGARGRLLARGGMAAVLAAALSQAAISGCTPKQRIHTETEVAKALISPEQENQIGAQMVQQVKSSPKMKLLNDPVVNQYVQATFAKLLPAAKAKRPDMQWQIFVIDDPKTVNAFSVPGGKLFVYSGLLLNAQTEAEVAGVIGHEMGHVLGYHAARDMVDTFGLEAIAALAVGKNPSLGESLVTRVAGTGLLLAHSRQEETEADAWGVQLSHAAGFDPQGMADFFKTLAKQEGHTPQALAWLSDHPLTPDRIDHVESIIQKNHWKGGTVGKAEQQQIQQRLQKPQAGL